MIIIKNKKNDTVRWRTLKDDEIVSKGDGYYWFSENLDEPNKNIKIQGIIPEYYYGNIHSDFILRNPSYKVARIAKKRIG